MDRALASGWSAIRKLALSSVVPLDSRKRMDDFQSIVSPIQEVGCTAPRKRHQMRHLCDLACFVAKQGPLLQLHARATLVVRHMP